MEVKIKNNLDCSLSYLNPRGLDFVLNALGGIFNTMSTVEITIDLSQNGDYYDFTVIGDLDPIVDDYVKMEFHFTKCIDD